MSDVYVLGIDMIKFGRYPEKNVRQLGAEAALLALARRGALDPRHGGPLLRQPDAGGRDGRPANPPGDRPDGDPRDELRQRLRDRRDGVPRRAGPRSRPASTTSCSWSARSSWARRPARRRAAAARASPRRACSAPDHARGVRRSRQEHARKYGTTFEQFAKVSVKNHHHSTKNPKSMYQMETPLEMVMNAEMIAYPNTKLMCSVNVDGAAAAVLARRRRPASSAWDAPCGSPPRCSPATRTRIATS